MQNTTEAAYLQAFEENSDALFRHAYFRLSSRERAVDLTQDTFIKAWDYLRGGGAIKHWKNFLYRVLNNLIIDEYRRGKTESLEALVEHQPAITEALLASGSRREKEEKLDEELLIEKVRELIPKLPDSYRVALGLRYVDGFSPKEIASILGISENVASVRVHRAVAQLRKLCEPLQ
jgi:RNA polymerase sigma-70 factor (ECF subfamily)